MPPLSDADQRDLRERSAVLETYTEGLVSICTLTDDPEAKAVRDFVADYGRMARPTPVFIDTYGVQVLGTYFAIVPLLARDGALGGYWAGACSDTSGKMAEYDADNNLVIVKGFIKCSDLIKGLLLFHEGEHAKTHIVDPYDSHDEDTYNQKERDTYEHQNRILSRLGGAEYRWALDEETQRLGDVVAGQPVDEVASLQDDYPALERVFGPPDSNLERDYRRTLFWIHAKFQLLEWQFGDKAAEYKLDFLRGFHRHIGVEGLNPRW